MRIVYELRRLRRDDLYTVRCILYKTFRMHLERSELPGMLATLCSYENFFGPRHPQTLLLMAETANACWQAGELDRLPEALLERISTGRYREAAVGSCSSPTAATTFTSYRVAVLLLRPVSAASRTLVSSK